MEKATSVLGALDAGKQPTTQQLTQFIDWLEKVGISSAGSDDLSSQGRVLAKDLREILEAWKQLALNKNGDNIVQEAIWHLGQGEIKASGVDKDQATVDMNALSASLRNLLSALWESLSSESGALLNDLVSFTRLSLADTAEVIETSAGNAKETLREIEEGVQKGQRTTFMGRDVDRVEEEKHDVKAKWDHGVDAIKGAGDAAIDTGRTVSDSVKDKKDKTMTRFNDAYIKICDRAQSDPRYRDAINTIIDVLQKRTHQTLDATKSYSLASFINDPTPEQHVPKALDHIQALLERFADMSLNPLFAKVRTCLDSIAGEPKLRQWFEDFFDLARKNLTEEGYARSDESQTKRGELRERWTELLQGNAKWKAAVNQVKSELQQFYQGLVADKDVRRLRAAHAQLGEDLEQGLIDASEKAQTGLEALMERATWFWQDLFRVYIPRGLESLSDIPIPRTEYKDSEIEFILENLDISTLNLLPSHVYIRNITDVDIVAPASATSSTRTSVGTLTRIKVDAVQLFLKDVSFWYKDLQSSTLSPSEFSGRLALTLPPQGISLDLKVRLIPSSVPASSPSSRASRGHYHAVEYVHVEISDDVTMEVKESNHGILLAMFKPIFVMRLREALERTLAEQVRAAIEWVDGVAWDVARRREVFEDTGVVGGGAAVLAGVWSEIGKLRREGKSTGVEWRATGTGVVVEQKEGDVQFAMGAEPQILSGEKRGPVGTASEPLAKRVGGMVEGATGVQEVGQVAEQMDVEEARERVGKMKKQAKGVVKEGQKKVQTFQKSVEAKKAQEEKKEGWRSEAFEF